MQHRFYHANMVSRAIFAQARSPIPRRLAQVQTGADEANGFTLAREQGIILTPEQYRDDVMARGGDGFVARTQQYARDPRGNPLVLRRWFLEICRALGDYRIGTTISTGASRTGKTVSNVIASIDLLVHGRLEAAMFYPDRASRDAFAPGDWRPLAKEWIGAIEEQVGAPIRRRTDKEAGSVFEVSGSQMHFRYASTSKDARSRDGKAAIGAAGAGFNANALFEDERSQWPSGIDFSARLNAGLFPTKPRRLIGTPGGGTGIEVYANNVDHYFLPHYHCDACGIDAPLDPFGCLLQAVEQEVNNKKVMAYLSRSNRPLDWWYADGDDKLGSAQICCSGCGAAIPKQARTIDAWMRCRDTGVDLAKYLDNIPPGDTSVRKIALHFSPLVRENFEHLGEVLIKDGFDENRDPRDWVQQDLGWPTVPSGDRLTNELLLPLIGARIPTLVPKRWTIAGVDMGRGQHWLWVMDIYPPKNWRQLHSNEIYRRSIRVVRFAGDIVGTELETLLDRYGVDFGLIDNEPYVEYAARMASSTNLMMADQKGSGTQDLAKKDTKIGGVRYDCYWINSDKYKQSVIDRATGVGDLAAEDNLPPYRFPAEWQQHLVIKSEASPLRHLCAVGLNPHEQKWIRPADGIDDLFFAAHFAEAAFAIKVRSAVSENDVEK